MTKSEAVEKKCIQTNVFMNTFKYAQIRSATLCVCHEHVHLCTTGEKAILSRLYLFYCVTKCGVKWRQRDEVWSEVAAVLLLFIT